MQGIKLKDILRFDELLQRFPGKRIKLRFNTDWDEIHEDGTKLRRSFLEMYEDGSKELIDSMLSTGPDKKNRNSNRDLTFQFIRISNQNNLWLLVDAYNITNANGCQVKNPRTDEGYNSATGERLTEYQSFFGRLVVEWKNLPQSKHFN